MNSVELEAVDWIKGVAVPRGVRFRQIIVTGPPASGKSSLIQKLGGWPEEGSIDLALDHWWRSRVLAFRPREVHFRVPFKGFRDSRTVFDREWLAAPTPVDYGRIQIPPGRIWFFQTNWRRRFVFDFQLPPPDRIYTIRKARASVQSHPVDRALTKAEVERQCAVYELLAQHFHRCGMRVIVRTDFEGMPRTIIDAEDY
ncbi:MAG: serine/threonine protein phosphatase [Pseudomonadota bacterium]